jgi:hypothetical protein
MIVYSSVTGVLNIYNSGAQGQLYFCDGTLYHIERGPSKGVEALAELLEQSAGNFAFVSDVKVEAESLWGSLAHHMQTAERVAIRWRQVRPYIPHLDLTPTLLVTRETALRRIGPAHQPVLATIDGQASLRQIAASLGWAEIDVAEAIVQMTIDSVVDLCKPRCGASPAAAPEPQQSGGLFDRIKPRSQAPARPLAEPELARAAESRASEELILKLLRG